VVHIDGGKKNHFSISLSHLSQYEKITRKEKKKNELECCVSVCVHVCASAQQLPISKEQPEKKNPHGPSISS
jgi:hypothetical protein